MEEKADLNYLAEEAIELKLKVKEVGKIMNILNRAPFVEVNGLVQRIFMQADVQIKDIEFKHLNEKVEKNEENHWEQ